MTWELTPELEDAILTGLENGVSLIKICDEPNMPSRRTVLRWQRENAEFGARCVHAREAHGDLAADRLDEINDKIEAGLLDASAANVISSNLKWRASKLAPKKYGDRVQQEITGKDGGPIETKDASPMESARRIAYVLAKAARDRKD